MSLSGIVNDKVLMDALAKGFHAGTAHGLQLRHDHASQFMSDDFQNELAFVGIESSPAFVREPEGNGCIERFFRTLKEQPLWVRPFRSTPELVRALEEFRALYNQHWLIERLGFEPPVQARQRLALQTGRLSMVGFICPRNQGRYGGGTVPPRLLHMPSVSLEI